MNEASKRKSVVTTYLPTINFIMIINKNTLHCHTHDGQSNSTLSLLDLLRSNEDDATMKAFRYSPGNDGYQ
jgi:hypothetical protein